jgi:hypothetical protein
MRPRLLPALLVPLLSACSVLTPPPMRMLHEPVLRGEPGATSVAIVAGAGAGPFMDPSAGGEVRVSGTVTREIEVEGALGAGGRFGHDNDGKPGVPNLLTWGRVGGRYRPDHIDWVTLHFGLGGGAADTGLAWMTPDLGLSFGYTFRNRVRPYVGLSLALAAPLDRGPVVPDADDDGHGRRPALTLWTGGSAGLSVRLVDSLELGAEFFTQWGWAPNGESGLALGGTGVLRYTFGPVRR